MQHQEVMYSIPARYRKTENLHIVFWLLKDLSWAMLWRPAGLIMIIPTIGAALLITWQTRHIKSELLHNLAVDFWILANAYWMLTEFYSKNEIFALFYPYSIYHRAGYYRLLLPFGEAKRKIHSGHHSATTHYVATIVWLFFLLHYIVHYFLERRYPNIAVLRQVVHQLAVCFGCYIQVVAARTMKHDNT